MKSSFFGILPLMLICATPAGAVCTQPVGSYVGGATQVDYYAYPVNVVGAENYLFSLTLNADKSGSISIRATQTYSNTVSSIPGTIAAASHWFNKTNCMGGFVMAVGAYKTTFNYTSADSGNVLTMMLIPASRNNFGSGLVRLERQ